MKDRILNITCQQPGAQSLQADDPKAKWAAKKKRAASLANAFAKRPEKRVRRWAERISGCANQLSFTYTKHNGGWRKELREARLCRVRTCPICHWRRSLKLAADLQIRVAAVREEYPDIQASLLTFTVRNCTKRQVRETVKAMLAAWNKVNQRKRFKGAVLGWVRALEVTPGKRGRKDDAHPHLHVLVFHEKDISHDNNVWADEWADALGLDYQPICHATPVNSLESAVSEVSKYLVKQADAPDEWVADMALQLDGIRAMGSGGILRTITGDELETTDADPDTLLPDPPVGERIPPWCTCVVIGYRWDGKTYRRNAYTFWSAPPPT